MKQAGQIVLFRFPQADLSDGKLRPALLINELPGPYESWLICMISSRMHQHIEGFDEIVSEEHSDFEASGLKQTSVIRIGRLAVVDADMLAGRIGSISSERLGRLRKKTCSLAQYSIRIVSIMKCTICKFGEMRDGKVTATLQRDSSVIVIKNVPAFVCENCGEFTLSENITKKMMELAEQAVANNAEIEVLQYAA